MTTEKRPESGAADDVVDHISLHAKSASAYQEDATVPQHSTLGHHESPEWKAAERGLVRKLDMTLLPTVWVLYMFNYLDRNNIA